MYKFEYRLDMNVNKVEFIAVCARNLDEAECKLFKWIDELHSLVTQEQREKVSIRYIGLE